MIPGLGRSTGEGIGYPLQCSWASFVAQLVKNLPAMWETWVRSLGWEDLLEEGKATHYSILAWRISINRGALQRCPWGFSRQEHWSGLPFSPPGDLSNSGTEPRSPALQVGSSPSEPQGKPKNTGVGSPSLLQGNFLTQELNWGLLHWQVDSLPLEPPRKPKQLLFLDIDNIPGRILEWVAFPFSRGSSQPRD